LFIRLTGIYIGEPMSREVPLAPLTAGMFYGITYGVNCQAGGGAVMALKDLEIKNL
jgi:hypothetical protein